MIKKTTGHKIHKFAKSIFNINRSLTGPGVRETLKELKTICPKLNIKSYNSNTKVFDWKIPLEWNLKDGYIIGPDGKKFCELKKNNLHIMGYSEPVEKYLSLSELSKKLHSIKKIPSAIPYVTSYYKKDWGFCISHNEKQKLKKGKYFVKIDSNFRVGKLNFGEVVIKGKSRKEILLSTNICHPSMANNELSGPSVSIFLAKWLSKRKNKYTYRILFLPETIGSIAYIAHNKKKLLRNVVAGYNIVCVGDDRSYSYMPSRRGDTFSDRAGLLTLKKSKYKFTRYKWLDRGSDERQYCSPGVDLPIATLCRSKYGKYKEYHTSLDDLHKVVTAKGLEGGYKLLQDTITVIEKSVFPKNEYPCEPMLSKRNLYPKDSKSPFSKEEFLLRELLTWADGSNSLDDLALKLNTSVKKIYTIVKYLKKVKLLKINNVYNG